MSVSSVKTSATTNVQIQRDKNDPDYGREEYIQDCVERVCKGEKVLVTLGGYWTASNLPSVLQNKFGSSGGVWFPGFKGARSEVILKVQALGKKVEVTEFRGGSNSDLLGIPYDSPASLDGYYISLVREQEVKTKSIN